jgi:hypothetical protein
MTPPRYFVLTAGDTPDAAIDLVESRGHIVVASSLTPACAVPVYGICEVEGPKAEEGTP